MCIFCKIASHEIVSNFLYEDDDFMVIMDLHPICDGHALVIPKRHYETVFDIPSEVLGKMTQMAKEIVLKEFKTLNNDGCSLSFNFGSKQEIKHAHMHIILDFNKKATKTVEEVYNLLKD